MKLSPMHRGFTLIEALIAIAIVALAVGGPLYSANRALVAAQNSRNQLTASYLAQEGIEYVRKVRDNDFLSDQVGGWLSFINTNPMFQCRGGGISHTCSLDPWAATPVALCSGGVCTALNIDGQGRFVQSSGTATIFKRKIYLIDVNANEDTVVSQVSWAFHGTTYDVTITDHLTSWQ